jgi:hypothetical protein
MQELFIDDVFRVDKDRLYDIRLCSVDGILNRTGTGEFSLVIRYSAICYLAGALDGIPFSDQHDDGWRVTA